MTIWPFGFATDAGVTAMAYLTLVLWPVGEVDRAISLIDRMQMRIADLTHVSTLATGSMFARHVRIDAGRPCARRSARGRGCPARASSMNCPCIAR